MWSKLRSLFEPYIDQDIVSNVAQYLDNHRVLTVVTAGLLLYGAWFFKRPKNLPPGPCGYPLVGCVHLMEKVQKNEFREKYGDIVCLWLGHNSYLVMLNSYEAIKEVYFNSGSIFMDRNAEGMAKLFGVADTIFSTNYDETYKESRKTYTQCMRTLTSSGLGNILATELTDMEKCIDCQLEESVDVTHLIQRIFTNTTTQLLFGRRYNDKESDILAEKNFHWNRHWEEVFFSLRLPWFWSIFCYKSRRLGRRVTEDIMEYVKDNITHHAPVEPDDEPKDVLSAYLQSGRFTDKEVIDTLFILMPDSIDSSPPMAMWVLLYLTNNPQCQEEIYQEIQEVCGDNIDLSMRSRMPVTESFIMEVFRLVTPFEVAVPNRPSKSTTLRGYNIPDYVNITANIQLVHYDEKIFPEPDIFKPKRFINNGKIGNTQGFIPFGTGRRMCVGDSVVRNSIFYIVARLILKYKMSPPDGVPLSTETSDDTFMKIPKKFTICFRRRGDKD